MNAEIQKAHGLEPLEEAQLVQQFQVEELEKRYEFSWFHAASDGSGDIAIGGRY